MILTAYITALLLYAWAEAKGDAGTIAAHGQVDHVEGWVRRAIVSFILALIANMMNGDGLWNFILFLVMAYGAWTPAFRFLLNRIRGKAWYYISPTSRYDRMFIGLCGYNFKRAGILAYAVEFAALTYSFIQLNT